MILKNYNYKSNVIVSITLIFNSTMIKMTSTPKRTCIKRDFLKLKDTSFSKWVQEPNHLYIHGNLSTFLKKKGTSDSIWYKDVKELQEFANDEEISYLTAYERCIRQTPELWNSLDNLENKVLGCWCKPSQSCHADVLIKLFNEKKYTEFKQEFGIQENKYEKYVIDLTTDE